MNYQAHPNRLVTLAALLLLAWPWSSRAQFNFTLSGGALTVSAYTGTNAYVEIPAATNGYPVKGIAGSAFLNKTMVTNVLIPDSITNLGNSAFKGCSGLTKVTIGNGVKNVGQSAFESCSSLPSLSIPASVGIIGQRAFYNCSGLFTVTIPGSVTNLGSSAFGNCLFLTSAFFQGNAPRVGGLAGSADSTVFYGNGSYYSQAGVVYYPPGTTGWGATFGSWPTVCTSNIIAISDLAFTTNNGGISINGYTGADQNLILPDNINGYPVTAIGDNAFSVNYQINSVLLPNGLTSIGNRAFYKCYNLVSAPLPAGLASIGDEAFQSCSGVTYMTIPAGVTNIGSGAFQDCYSLLNLNVAAGNPNYASLRGVLFDSAFTTLIQYPPALGGDYVIPGTVTNVAGGAFYSAGHGLKSVTIPNSVLNIGDPAFTYCNYLYSFTVAADNPNYASVGGVLFDKAITTLIRYPGNMVGNYVIPGSVTRIGDHAFYSAYGVKSLTIPDSVTNIDDYALFYCSSLTNITVGAGNPNFASAGGVLFNWDLTTLIQYPIGLTVNYAIPDGVIRIANYAFYYCNQMKQVTMPDSVTDIGDSSFFECYGLTSLAIGNGVTRIGSNAFLGCTALANVTIPSSVTNIGDHAFAYCSGLKSVVIPASVSKMGQNAFQSCTALHLAYFQGDAPTVNGGAGSADNTIFTGESGTAFYPPGAIGWGSTFGGWPAIAGSYQPQPQIAGPGQVAGGPGNGFQFNIFWATNSTVVVEASTNLLNWTPVITSALVSGTNTYTDSNWTNFPTRFYRVRSQ